MASNLIDAMLLTAFMQHCDNMMILFSRLCGLTASGRVRGFGPVQLQFKTDGYGTFVVGSILVTQVTVDTAI